MPNPWYLVAVVVLQCAVIAWLILERQRRRDGSIEGGAPRELDTKAEELEEGYRSVVEHHSDLICRYLPDTTLTFVSDSYCRFWGRSREQLLGTSFLDLIPPVAREAAVEHVASMLRNPRIETNEHEVMLPDGRIGWQQWVDCVLYDADGRVTEFQATGRDITERKRAEEALLEREQLFRAIFDSAGTGISLMDLSGERPVESNRALQTMLRCTGEELARIETFDELTVEEDRARDAELHRELCEGARATLRQEKRFRLRSGEEIWANVIFTLLTDADSHPKYVLGMHEDITDRKRKEAELREALSAVRRLSDQLHAENLYLHEELAASEHVGDLVCRSASMRAVLTEAGRVAPTLTPVLIMGETGTGKEVLARTIHSLSGRREQTLVRVNCAALPASLIESELFGHERGAFTGAAARRAGRFELADGGTIFLDEIGELPLELQPKLLRVLQEGEFERVGGSRTLRVSVRVLAATNRDLAAAVKAGTFRADLYYRLNVFPIYMPPLRERIDDIGPMATMFLDRAKRRVGRDIEGISQETLTAFESYAWPGNVRELQNVIERGTVISRGRVFRLPDDWAADHHGTQGREAAGTILELAAGSGAPLPLHEVERQYIQHILRMTQWRVEGRRGAATILGLKPSTLRSRMTKLGILPLRSGGARRASSASV